MKFFVQSSPTTRITVSLILVAAVIAAWFATLPGGTIIGDDLGFVWRDQRFGPGQMMPYTKFRPVLVAIMAMTIPIFGNSYAGYVGFNIAIEIAIAILIFFIARLVTDRNDVVASVAALTFALSRFSYFAILQVGGIMENLALALTLLIVYDVIWAYKHDDARRLFRILVWFAIVLFTDERYVVLLPFVCLSPLSIPRVRSNRSALGIFVAIAGAIFLGNVFVKSVILHIHFLEGSGRELGFEPATILQFFWNGALNLVGFNIGPDYLSARDVSETGGVGYVLGFLTMVPILVAVVAFGIAVRRGMIPGAWRIITLSIILVGSLLLSGAVSFRQEFRFLYTPYAVVIVAMSAIAGLYRSRQNVANAIACYFLIASVASSVFYRQYVGNIYYEYSQSFANVVRTAMAEKPVDLAVIVTHGEPSVRNFIFQGHTYFDVYGFKTPLVFVDNPDQASAATRKAGRTVIFDGSATSVVRFVESRARTPLPSIGDGIVRYSFVRSFERGKLNSLAAQTTPSGHGAVRMSWGFGKTAIESLTVLAGFRDSFTDVPIAAGDELSFVGAAPYSIGIGVRGFVDITDRGHVDRIVNREFLEALPSGPRWAKVAVPLDRYVGRRVNITFGAEQRGADSRAAWMVFGDAAVRSRLRQSGRGSSSVINEVPIGSGK